MRRTLVACLVLSPFALAQEPQKVVSGRLGFDVTSQYFFRGILQENQGIIFQPSVELGYDLYEADSEDSSLQSLDLRFGLWNSLHDGPTGGAGGIWYESDFYVEVGGKIGDGLGVSAAYWTYHTPNGTGSFSKATKPVEELVFRVDYDDRGKWLSDTIESGLQPWVVLAIEVDGQRDVVTGGHVGTYAEFGVRPEFQIGKLGDGDLTLALPSRIGVSLGDYYERTVGGGNDDFFGYLDLGAELSAPLTFLPARMGPWDGYAALHLLLLGDNNEARNGGDVSELIFSFGFATFF